MARLQTGVNDGEWREKKRTNRAFTFAAIQGI
jgi:hypothetical protein